MATDAFFSEVQKGGLPSLGPGRTNWDKLLATNVLEHAPAGITWTRGDPFSGKQYTMAVYNRGGHHPGATSSLGDQHGSDSPSPLSKQAVRVGLPAQGPLLAPFPWVGKASHVGFS